MQRVLTSIWLTKGETARRVRQRIGAVLDYAHGKGWRNSEAPMRALNQLLGGIRQPRSGNFAAMPYKGLPAFMAKLREGDLSVGRLALQFLILTAARSGEVRKARWQHIDPEACEWRVPAENAKTGKLHIVPLVPAALEVLERICGMFGIDPDDLVFPGLNGPMSDATLGEGPAGQRRWRLHRSWVPLYFPRLGGRTGVCRRLGGGGAHPQNPNRTEGAYRRTTFFEQRRDTLMPAWATFVGGQSESRCRNVGTDVRR